MWCSLINPPQGSDPDWAKDKDGNWALAYTGTIAFIINNDLVKEQPKSWADLRSGNYRVTIGDVGIAARANSGVLSAALPSAVMKPIFSRR